MPLPITKTPKCYVGGKFIRSESSRTYELHSSKGEFLAHIPLCSRKDVRNAVEAAASAGPGWAKRSPYNRAQILYRLAEMIESRSSELVDACQWHDRPGHDSKKSEGEVRATIERIVHYAGWADKYEQVLGSVNPVASSHFNFTVSEPMGIIGVLAPENCPLLALLTLILPAITSGNAVVALASESAPYPSILLGEMMAVSDLPGGVVNLLTGPRSEMLPTFATHEHLRALNAVANQREATTLQQSAAESVKRVKLHDPKTDWFSADHDSPYAIRDFLEAKTVWHPIGA